MEKNMKKNTCKCITVPLFCTAEIKYNIVNQLYLHLLTGSEKAMAPHSSTLAWKIPWTEEPGGLQFMGLLRVRHD